MRFCPLTPISRSIRCLPKRSISLSSKATAFLLSSGMILSFSGAPPAMAGSNNTSESSDNSVSHLFSDDLLSSPTYMRIKLLSFPFSSNKTFSDSGYSSLSQLRMSFILLASVSSLVFFPKKLRKVAEIYTFNFSYLPYRYPVYFSVGFVLHITFDLSYTIPAG